MLEPRCRPAHFHEGRSMHQGMFRNVIKKPSNTFRFATVAVWPIYPPVRAFSENQDVRKDKIRHEAVSGPPESGRHLIKDQGAHRTGHRAPPPFLRMRHRTSACLRPLEERLHQYTVQPFMVCLKRLLQRRDLRRDMDDIWACPVRLQLRNDNLHHPQLPSS